MIRINLLPVREAKLRESARQLVSIGGLSVILVVIAIVFFHLKVSGRVDILNSEVSSTQEQINQLNKKVGDIEKYRKQKKELEDKIKVIDMLSRQKTGPVHILDELSMSIPGKVWLTSLRESSSKLTLTGIALDNETIADFMKNLERSPYFSNIELVQSQQHLLRELKLESFSITCDVQLPEKK
ncbi:MAG: PilN domain-containing protein [Pseudomonadota bacterium]